MNTAKTQFVIEADGQIFREDINRIAVDPGDALQRAFTTGICTRVRNIMEIPGYGMAHMVYEADQVTQHWSIPMEKINFRTTFRANENGELYPTFAAANQTVEPIIEIEWDKAQAMSGQESTMNIRFIALVKATGEQWYVVDHYLYAFDGRKTCYRLPIANLYDTCQICMGEYRSTANTALESVQKALAQFRTASWNSDLFYNESDIQKFIRFKPLEKGFQTLPIKSGWTTSCQKIATAYLKFVEI